MASPDLREAVALMDIRILDHALVHFDVSLERPKYLNSAAPTRRWR
jgi:hypothetical protein